jgi:hypothetical protein
MAAAVNSQQREGILNTTRCLKIIDKVILLQKIVSISIPQQRN